MKSLNDNSTSPLTRLPHVRQLALLAALLALGVVAWEHIFHVYVLGEGSDRLAGHLSHILRDTMLIFPLALLVLAGGLRLARFLGMVHTDRHGMLGVAAVISLLLILLMAPMVNAHGFSHQLLDANKTTGVTAADGHDHGHSHDQGSTVEQTGAVWHGLRDALVGQVAALPLAMLCLVLLLRWERRRFPVRPARFRSPSARAIFRAAAASAIVLSLLPLQSSWAGPSTVVQANAASPCGGAPDRTYDISAIHVQITLNRFGDYDPNGYMYVLQNQIAAVNAQASLALPDRVSTGLRKDAIQPLVIRANLGECVQINFTNELTDGPASFHIHGLSYAMESAGSHVGYNADTFADGGGGHATYYIPIPTDPNAEHAYYFHDHGANRPRVAHGLFGALVVEPAGSQHLDPETGEEVGVTTGWSNWEAIIVPPNGDSPAFREFVLMYHEIGDENYDGLRDDKNQPIPVLSEFGTYRPAGRGINYRSEPFRDRLLLNADKSQGYADKSQGYSSYAYGDPATPIPRSYLGEPTKTRLMHGGSEVFHVHHLHGGGDRWPRNPNAVKDPNDAGYDQNKFISSGLTKTPIQNAHTTRLDSQSIGPGTSYNLEHECGAGGCQQAAGDFLYHCHIGHHYLAGMWGFWRVFDTQQADLAPLPVPALDPPEAVSAHELIGRVFDGKIIGTDITLAAWVESQLPPQGVKFDDQDATVWDWSKVDSADGLIYLGEPEDSAIWANYHSSMPGERPEILFNPSNGRYTWPLMRPHLGKRPPFSPNGHSGAPWLGEQGSAQRPDGLCPNQEIVPDPGPDLRRQTRHYPITAIKMPIQLSPTEVDDEGRIFVLNEEKADVLSGVKPAQPLAIRSNVGDCVKVILTSELEDDFFSSGHSKVNMHIHFVQFDPQASDGVITGFSYEQSVRPYATEERTLTADATVGDSTIQVTNVDKLRQGVWIGIGLGEGMCATAEGDRPCTEIRRIKDEIVGNTITLDQPLALDHSAGQAVGVEFVQYAWYSDVDTGTVFWHDHVNFKSWDHGLFGAHIIEPAGSTYRDPQTGAEVRSGTIVDVHTPPDASVGAGQVGSFRELMLFHHNRTASRPEAPLDAPGSTFNLRAEPTQGRGGDPAYTFSSVTHGDPVTPLPRAYVGDPFVIRHLGVVERVGGIRVTGHRFSLERWAEEGALTDTSPLGISERFDLVLDNGAGGASGMPGDYLYYSTKAREFMAGGWGIIRVHDTAQSSLQPLPGRNPPQGKGFPSQTHTGDKPQSNGNGNKDKICPANAPLRTYDVDITPAYIVGNDQPLQIHEGVAYVLSKGPNKTHKLKGKALVREPLVLRVNEGECLEINLHNRLDENASLSIGKLPFDPQSSYGAAIGYNLDSTVEPNKKRRYRFYADKELGTAYMLNLANPATIALGAFGGVIVEPAGAIYLDPYTGKPLKTGVTADIVGGANGDFREFVALFHDQDKEIGQSRMPYPTEVAGFTGINYATAPLADRLATNPDRSLVFDSDTHGDPRYVLEAHRGDNVTFRVASPWAEQMHVFSLEGHRWPLEPKMAGSEQLFSQLLAPGYVFDAPLIGSAGGDFGATGDYLFHDHRLPFRDAGLWGIFAVLDPSAGTVQPLGGEDPNRPVVQSRGQLPASTGAIVKAINAAQKSEEDPRITLNTAVLDISLEPGADRGAVTQPLYRGTIQATGNRVYFVLSDVSDPEFAAEYGTIFARGLIDADARGVEEGATLVETANGSVWTFAQDPGRVAHFNGSGETVRAIPNLDYSPLKRIQWRGREVIVNVPFVKWGDEPGQQLIVDEGGCNPLIRLNRPSPFFVGNGPPGCTPDEQGIERYFGGKVLAIDIESGCDNEPNSVLCASVTAKLEIGTHRPDVFPYYTVWEASKAPPAEFMGVLYAPKLGFLSPPDEVFNIGLGNRAVAHIAQFANGVEIPTAGPLRFQPGLTSYSRIEDDDYSPFWHITMLFFDCDADGVSYAAERNVSPPYSAAPGPGIDDDEGVERFNPALPLLFDPFGMNNNRIDCAKARGEGDLSFLQGVTGNDDGFIYIGELEALIAAGHVIETQAPAGWTGMPFGGSLDTQNPLLINCPAPVSVDLNKNGMVATAQSRVAEPTMLAPSHFIYLPLVNR